MPKPFYLFSWHLPFLPALKQFICEQTDGHPGTALIIVPNRRPWRYFSDLYRQDGKATVLPRMMTFEEMASIWNNSFGNGSLVQANVLDQIALLYEIIQELPNANSKLLRQFARMSMNDFLPWGARLANLLEEYGTQGIEPDNIAHAEGEVSEFAARLLEALGSIGAAWQKRLQEEGMTTRGQEIFNAAKNRDQIPKLLKPGPNRPVFIAGFAQPRGAQIELFHSLWKAGAYICVQGDPGLATEDAHWSCDILYEWAKLWHTGFELINGDTRPAKQTEFNFYAAYDGHSQLLRLRQRLQKTGNSSEAVILLNPAMLAPTLYHLPRKDINISIGFPLSRTSLRLMLSDIMQLIKRRRPAGKYYWRDLRLLFSHQLLARLEKAYPDGTILHLKDIIEILQRLVVAGEKFVDLNAILQACKGSLDTEQAKTLVDEFAQTFIAGPDSAHSPRQLAEALGKICDFLLDNGAGVWEELPLDAEALSRLRDVVLPVLRENALADVCFPAGTLSGILFTLLDQEEVPFEAFPLVGLQVLGILETRLLQFDDIYFLDASEDTLPGIPAQDPLLPDNLRSSIGLPDASQRQRETAYNLYRLCAGAKSANFFWSEGTGASGKKFRSRYVEQLIWDKEQQIWNDNPQGRDAARFLANPLVESATVNVRLIKKQIEKIFRTDELNNAIAEIAAGSLNPTLIKDYLVCPKSFIYKRVLGLKEPPEVIEGDDALLTGSFVHRVLKEFFAGYKGCELHRDELDKKELIIKFRELLEEERLDRKLAAHSYLYLDSAAPVLLGRYLDNFPDSTIIHYIEDPLGCTLELAGQKYRFCGMPDRIDERDSRLFILDYKTGSLPKPKSLLWQDKNFLGNLAACNTVDCKFGEGEEELFTELRQNLVDPQLLVYLLMLREVAALPAHNAALVDLQDSGKEQYIWPEDQDRDELFDAARASVGFILKHMQKAEYFAGNPERCDFCAYNAICHA